jgi:hypothetical protein
MERDDDLTPKERLARAERLLAESQRPAAPGQEDRRLTVYQVIAIFEIAVAYGVPMSRLARVRRLVGDLEDLDRGKTSELLTATPLPTKARPVDNTVLWEARAAAVAAFEALRDLGEQPARAATLIDRAITLARFGVEASPYRTLRRWRADFAAPPGVRAPKEGMHWEVLEIARADRKRFRELAGTAPQKARERLTGLYRGMIRHADCLLPDGPRHFAGKEGT